MALSEKARLYLKAALVNKDVATEVVAMIEAAANSSPDNLAVNITPQTDGALSVGTETKAFNALYLKDTVTGQIYRIEIENGVFQADEVL